MSAEHNIKMLFSELRLEHFFAYLAHNGWLGAPEPRPDRVRFELPDETLPDDEPPYVLLLPSSSRAAQYRKHLQMAVYNLSGIEDRQPAELILDLLEVEAAQGPIPQSPAPKAPATNSPATKVAAAGAGAGAEQPIRLRIRNLNSEAMTIEIASRTGANTLMPGEAMEIVSRPSGDGIVELGFAGSSITVDDRRGG